MSSIAYPHVTYKEGFCGWCGEETLLYRNGKPKKWCSDYCGTSASSFRKTGRIAPLPEDRKAPVTHCLYCGDELQVTAKSRATKKYCNDSCSLKYRRSNNPRYRKLAREWAQKNAARDEAAKPPKPRCAHCGDELARRRSDWKFCSKPKCKRASNVDLVASSPRCDEPKCFRPRVAHGLCGTHYTRKWHALNPEVSQKIRSKSRRKRRAMELEAFVEDVDMDVLLERDGWVCGICNGDIPKSATYPDLLSPSLDHVVPLARGGKHEYANAQAAHYGCNSAKQDKVDFVMS